MDLNRDGNNAVQDAAAAPLPPLLGKVTKNAFLSSIKADYC